VLRSRRNYYRIEIETKRQYQGDGEQNQSKHDDVQRGKSVSGLEKGASTANKRKAAERRPIGIAKAFGGRR
jgi:hypothetical protein